MDGACLLAPNLALASKSRIGMILRGNLRKTASMPAHHSSRTVGVAAEVGACPTTTPSDSPATGRTTARSRGSACTTTALSGWKCSRPVADLHWRRRFADPQLTSKLPLVTRRGKAHKMRNTGTFAGEASGLLQTKQVDARGMKTGVDCLLIGHAAKTGNVVGSRVKGPMTVHTALMEGGSLDTRDARHGAREAAGRSWEGLAGESGAIFVEARKLAFGDLVSDRPPKVAKSP